MGEPLNDKQREALSGFFEHGVSTREAIDRAVKAGDGKQQEARTSVVSPEWVKDTYNRYHNGSFTNWPAIAKTIEALMDAARQASQPDLRQLLIDAMHIIHAEVPEQGRRGWANTLAKIRSVLEYPAKDDSQPSHASGEPSISYTVEQLNLMLDRRGQDEFQRGQQAMAEKAAQLVAEWRTRKIPLPGYEYADELEEAIRSLAGAEPQPSSVPNKENE